MGERAPATGPAGLGLKPRNTPLLSSWFSRIHREYEAGNLTLHYREVLLVLGRFHTCRFGIFPSHQTLATRARCSVRTVQRALQAARGLGLLDWAARRVKAAWRSLRASNRYVLRLPAGPVRTPLPTTGQRGRGVTYLKEKSGIEETQPVAAAVRQAAQAVLDAVRARRMRQLGLA
jgi:hypothetical protein